MLAIAAPVAADDASNADDAQSQSEPEPDTHCTIIVIDIKPPYVDIRRDCIP